MPNLFLESIMPKIVSSCGDHFGVTIPEVLGSCVPIQAVLADQSASVFGSGLVQFIGHIKCFKSGKCTFLLLDYISLISISYNIYKDFFFLFPSIFFLFNSKDHI